MSLIFYFTAGVLVSGILILIYMAQQLIDAVKLSNNYLMNILHDQKDLTYRINLRYHCGMPEQRKEETK